MNQREGKHTALLSRSTPNIVTACELTDKKPFQLVVV